MASDKLNLEQLVEVLELSEYYPEKLSRDELYQLTINTLRTDRSEDVPLVWQFIQNITRYNYNARNVENKYVPSHDPSRFGFRKSRAQTQRDIKCRIHPLDIIVCVFLCCEPTARQDLVLHMWTCRLAVPFILQPNQTRHVTVHLWPLRSLIGQILEKYEFIDRPLIHAEMDCIGFVRAGENDAWSKSYLLDCLIWGPDKTHPTFIHRDSEGSKRTRSCAVEGLVEIGWYLPSGEKDDRFSSPKLILNLRGDSTDYPEQTKIIGQMASVTIVLTTIKDLSSSVPTVKSLIEQKSRVIIILSDKSIESDRLVEMIEEFFSDIPMEDLELLELEQKRLPDILKCIHFNIKQMEEIGKNKIVLSDFVKNISSMTASVDETSNIYKEVFKLAEDITTSLKDSQKLSIFPLQETYWKEWAQTSRDFHRYHQLDEKKRKALRVGCRNELETRMIKLRSKQYEHMLKHGIAKSVELFIKAMSNFDSYTSHGHVKRRIFLRLIKTELDNMSIQKLVPINKEYQELINKATGAKAYEKVEINKKISDLDFRKSCLSFGLENILRELGQIYEACKYESRRQTNLSINDNNRFVLDQYQKLPKYLCFCLMDGYPFELLDGEARSVPPEWTKAVLSELESFLKDGSVNKKEPKIHVLSVLGVQSSGKSTLTNVMFGLQFAVSAGRCTRGAFMQLVKVHESLSHYFGDSVDYIAVIDTEGLRSPELSTVESIKHDNELSTLVIGLAHTTVINLMGENAKYLEENLPIVVQAFLRMYLVHLHPRCTIVHHNVDKRNREKMLQQGLILQTVLNQLTHKACEIEKVPQKTFKDIIAFDVVEHTKYIPSLLEGVLPMAPISSGYSMEANATRKLLVEFLKKDYVTYVPYRYSILSFSKQLFHLWNAIQKDNFLYEFRSTTEVALRLDIDRNYLRTLLGLIEDVESSVSEMLKTMENPQIAIPELEKVLAERKKTRQDMFEQFIDCQKNKTPFFPEEWRTNYVECFEKKFSLLLQEAETQLKDCHESIKKRPRLTAQEIKDFHQRCKEIPFEDAFNELKPNKTLISSKHNYKSDATEALKDVCFPSRHLLKLDNIDDNASISKFRISDEIHINHQFGNFTETEICEFRKIMGHIVETVRKEYQAEIFKIRSKRRIHSYSCRIPIQIMLRVERSLSDRLQSDDVVNGISNQFKIDLLSCVAMTCVRDMKGIYNAKVELQDLKMNLHSSILKESKMEKSLSGAIFEVIEKSLRHNFSEKVIFYIFDALHKSIYKTSIGSKGQMIGSCIKYFIKNSRDDIMLEYIRYPKYALAQYLTILIETYISETFLECDFQFYIRRSIDQVWRAFERTGMRVANISQRCILEAILLYTDLPVDIKDIARIEIETVVPKDETVSFTLLRDNMLQYVEKFIEKMLSDLKTLVLEKKEDCVSVLADSLTERLIGCLHRCQTCKEICLLSEGHGSSHIFLHRVNDNENDYYHRPVQIATVWKWLSCQKHDVLRRENLQLVNEFPDAWRLITKQEVISDLEDSFLRS